MTRLGLALETPEARTPAILGEVINHTETHYWVRITSGQAIDDEACERIEAALGAHVAFVSPVCRVPFCLL